jgi:hypothetical protein
MKMKTHRTSFTVRSVDYDTVYICVKWTSQIFKDTGSSTLYVRMVSVISARNIFAIWKGFYVCVIDLLDIS